MRIPRASAGLRRVLGGRDISGENDARIGLGLTTLALVLGGRASYRELARVCATWVHHLILRREAL